MSVNGSLQPRLPSITTLKVFESCARHQSFTRAAAELHLTQSAVSHQIKKLEQQVAVQLFVRGPDGISLTEAGLQYVQAVRPLLDELAAVTMRAYETGNESVLVVACLGTFAIKCLLPHLHSFRERNPGVNIRLVTVDSIEILQPNTFDAAIGYGLGEWPRMRSDRITHEQIMPVCSPRLLAGGARLKEPADLRFQTIIRTQSDVVRDFWPEWLQKVGMENEDFPYEVRCNRLSISIQAAHEGIGVALARTSIARRDLEAGLLIEPFSTRLTTEEGYFLISPMERAGSRKVERFRSWCIETLGPPEGQPFPA